MGWCSLENHWVAGKNVSSRYSAVQNYGRKKMMGFNNIELISDRPLEINLREITEVVKMFPDGAMRCSLDGR